MEQKASLSKSAQQYAELYDECKELICQNAPEIMNSIRDEAAKHFNCIGLPSKKVERYKYTDVNELFAPNYGLNLNRLHIPTDPSEVFQCDVPNLSTSLYFVVNDQFDTEHLPKASLPEGMIVDSLAKVACERSELIKPYYGKLAKTEEDGITALNTMLVQDGLLVYVPRHVKATKPIQILNIMRSDVPLMANRRVLIIMEEGAEAKLLFCDHAVDDHDFLSTQVIEAHVADNAHLELYCLEESHEKNTRFSNVYIDQKANSHVQHHVITLHNGTTRNRLDLKLNGEGANCELYGCVIADKNQHVDNNTVIDHAVPHCQSNQLYKYVLDDNAVGAFAGKVLVQKDAQHTTSEERNHNICMTNKARMYAQPMLEIYADDVKCSHGSTVGQLNDAALFYMQQRGISIKEAKLLLEFAFVGEVIDQISLEPLRERLHYLVEKRFRGELYRCGGCNICK